MIAKFAWVGVVGMWMLGFGMEVAQEMGAPVVYAREPEPPEEVLIEVKIDWTQERIQKEIETVAAKYGVSSDVMQRVIKCESNYNPTALGDGGKSRGLVQIHSGFHATTDEEAYDPAYAIDFLARHLAMGKGDLWTCYRMLH